MLEEKESVKIRSVQQSARRPACTFSMAFEFQARVRKNQEQLIPCVPNDQDRTYVSHSLLNTPCSLEKITLTCVLEKAC